MKYYTYAYLREDGTPYYIGKGIGGRINAPHFRSNKTKKIIPLPPKERRLLLKQNLTEEEAFRHEIYMIAVFGRKDLETGILLNLSKGGDKPPSQKGKTWKMSEKSKEKMRKPKNYVRTAEHSNKIGEANKGKKHSEEHKKKISEKIKLAYKEGRMKPPINSIRAKHYVVIHPDGSQSMVYNMKKFCEEMGLTRACMCNVAKGKELHHKGYFAKYF